MDINAQNKEKYIEDLKNWLCELESTPLEEMGAFFRKRLPEYEACLLYTSDAVDE